MKVALTSLLLALASLATAQQPPSFPREMRGVWVATVSNIDWPTSKTLTPAQQRSEITAILNRAEALNLNTILLQVRPACDALYNSTIDPWSPYLTNAMGVPPNPYYDPLSTWIKEAHARGIEVHAWVNPYRALASTSTQTSQNHISQTRPDLIRTYGTALYLDPGHPDTPQYVRSVINDLVARYDLDGIVFDDYFYPYPISGVPFPDDSTYNAYLAGGGTLSRSNWRRKNVDDFVEAVYNDIKAARPTVKFGISPFGIWRPGNPTGITGLDSYASIYADSRKWLQQGWLDYFSPQLYWRIDPPAQSYPALLTWWTQQNTMNRNIVPSNYTSNVNSSLGNWNVSEIVNQIGVTRTTTGTRGNIHFSERAFRLNYKGIYDTLRTGVYAGPALPHRYSWLDNSSPARPALNTTPWDPGAYDMAFRTLRWSPQGLEATWVYAVYWRYGTTWHYDVLPSTTSKLSLPTSHPTEGELNAFAVSSVDRCGNESTRAIWPNE